MGLVEKAREFEHKPDVKQRIQQAWQDHAEFLKAFPLRQNPSRIDSLTPEDLYNPGTGGYFFYWIEHRLKPLGHLRLGSAQVFRNAATDIEKFKRLLRTAVSDDKSLAEKVDAPWEGIPGFGGDKHVAKKIIFCYYPDNIMPIFNTTHLEHQANNLGINLEEEASGKYRQPYASLTLGQKWELLTEALLRLKRETEVVRDWDNACFMRFLFDQFAPPSSSSIQVPASPKPFIRSAGLGLLWEPKNEQEVLFLFAKFHHELGFPYILQVQAHFPDITVIDNDKQTKRIEVELAASHFRAHQHDPSGCDYVLCWQNDLTEEDEGFYPEVIALKEELGARNIL